MITIAAPGQGSQSPGFLIPWLENEVFAAKLDELSGFTELDLARLGSTADADEIKDTAIAQPLIVSSSIASFAALESRFGESLKIFGACGHSVGEIAAAYVAGIFDTATAGRLVRLRGSEMAKAAAISASSMAAVVGGDQQEVIEKLQSLGLTAANYNGPGQIVAAGESELIAKLVSEPPSGTRVVQLAVAGAFHTEFMEPAVSALSAFADTLSPNDPKLRIWTNRDGSKVAGGREYLRLLVQQVSSPVRWDLTMKSMLEAGTTAMIELLPAGVLTGIAKRAMPGVETVAVKTPEDFEKVAKLIEGHS